MSLMIKIKNNRVNISLAQKGDVEKLRYLMTFYSLDKAIDLIRFLLIEKIQEVKTEKK